MTSRLYQKVAQCSKTIGDRDIKDIKNIKNVSNNNVVNIMDDIADKVDNVKITPSILSISMMTLQKNVTQMLKTVFCKNIA